MGNCLYYSVASSRACILPCVFRNETFFSTIAFVDLSQDQPVCFYLMFGDLYERLNKDNRKLSIWEEITIKQLVKYVTPLTDSKELMHGFTKHACHDR